MLKYLFPVLIFATVLLACAVGAMAGGQAEGMELFKKHCKICHIAGTEGGPLTPISKTEAQWTRFFDKNRHKKNPAAWSKLTDQDLKQIRQWLRDRAADSQQPETCG